MAKRKRQLFVAIVDDNAEMRAAIENLLNSSGLRTRSFSSAERFLQSTQRHTAACLILDFRLPGMTELELHRELQAKGLAIPVIFVTAEVNITAFAEAGAMAVLRKPFDPEELSRLVKIAIDAHGRRS